MADDLFADVPMASAGGQRQPNVSPSWQERPVPQGAFDPTSPNSPPSYAMTPAQAVAFESAGKISEPYLRLDPETGQQFLRGPVPAPTHEDPFGDVPMASGHRAATAPAPDFRPHGAGDIVNQTLRSFARGVPVLGAMADEGSAAFNAWAAPYVEPILNRMDPSRSHAFDIGSDGSYGDRYARALAMQRGMDAGMDAAHPNLSAGLKIAGGAGGIAASALMAPAALAPVSTLAKATGLVPRMAAGALDGALIGGAQGYASGDGDWTDPSRLHDAITGGGWGAAGGGVLPALGAGAKAAWNSSGRKLLDAMLPNAKFGGQAASQIPTQGERIADLIAQFDGAATKAIPGAAAGAGAVPSVTVPASASQIALERLAQAVDRQGVTPVEAINRARSLGPYGSLADVGEQTADLARTVANMPGPARNIIGDAMNLRQAGKLVNGEYVAPPASTRIADAAADGLGLAGRDYHSELDQLVAAQKRAAGPAYAKAYQAEPVPMGNGSVRESVERAWAKATGQPEPTPATGPLADFTGSPIFKQAYDRARGISQKEFVPQPDGTEKIVPLPADLPPELDWRTLDLVKQALDDMVKEGKMAGIGANEQGALKGYLKRFVATLDGLNPDYAAARAAFSGPARMMDAAEAGRAFFRDDAATGAKAMAELSPGEKDMFRVGAIKALRDKLESGDVTYDAARRAGFLQPAQLARFKELFPDRDTYAKFANLLDREKTLFDTRARIGGNSTTVRQANDAAEAENPLELIGHAHSASRGDLGSMAVLAGKLFKPSEGPFGEDARTALATMLADTNPHNFPGYASGMAEAMKRKFIADMMERSMAPAGAMAGSAVGGERRQ